ncbi:MAG: hypothetical protein Ct9H90mP16_16370 [Candidatus Poseidoniales archaeon]|nr:MAG: hypothetical protein Ct9H90mP16_16370 [Candidatus Poseidoniales archaeon]
MITNESALIAHQDGVRFIDLAPGAEDIDHLQGHSVEALSYFCSQFCEIGESEGVWLALAEEEGNAWLHSTEDLSNWSSHLLIDDGSALTYSMATDNDEIIVTVGGILGSQTCTGSTPDSMNCESDSTERRDLFMHANSTWFVEGQSLHQLDDGASTPAWELGLPNGTILAYSNDALWVENAGLWVWNGSEFESIEISIPSAATQTMQH